MARPATVVRFAVLGVGAAYSLILALSGVELDDPAKAAIGWLPAAASTALIAWDALLWRAPGVQHFSHRPRIDGLWAAELRPSPESHIPEGGNRGPIESYVVVTQSFWSLHVRQLTAESASESRSFVWSRPAGGVDQVVFTYENVPQRAHVARSPRHLGTCSFDTATLVPATISGAYFTDRLTQGDMVLRLVGRGTAYDTFADAQAHARRIRPT